MSDATPSLAESGEAVFGTAQSQALGFELVSSEKGVGAMRVPFREDLVGDPEHGVIAGGVITTLLDQTCGLAIRAAMTEKAEGASEAGRMGSMATLDLRIDYMRPARPGAGVVGRAHCYKITRSIAFVRAVAFEDDPEDPIATAQAAFALTPGPRA